MSDDHRSKRGPTRREFLSKALLTAATLPLARYGRRPKEYEIMQNRIQAGEKPLALPGLQLYTVRDLMELDPAGTLARVAEIGYKEVEFASYAGLSPAEIVSLLEENDLASPSAHVSFDSWGSSTAKVIEDAAAIGHKYLLCAWIPEEKRQTLDDWRYIADRFNEWGAACRDGGLQFAFHNHNFEFTSLGEVKPYDLLLERCDADLVAMEIDLYWIRYAGRDPIPYFEKYPGRFPMCHVKDMDSNGEMTEVGTGVIDFAADFEHAHQAGLKHFFVEHDHPIDPMASIAESYKAISSLLDTSQ